MTRDTTETHRPSEIALLVLTALWLLPFIFTTYFNQDEFTLLSGALRQLHGQVIYRDYFEFTAPLVTWLPALCFRLFGPSLLVARALQAFALWIASWQLYRLAGWLSCRGWTAMLPGLVLVGVLYPIWPGYSHHWIVLPFLLAALLALYRALESSGLAWWALAGSWGALDFLAMQSDGVALLAFLAVVPLVDWAFECRGLLGAVKRSAGVLAGAFVPLALAGGYLLSQHALRAAYLNVWVWPLTHYKMPGNVNDIKWATWLPREIATNLPDWVNLPTWYATVYHAVLLYALLPATAAIALAWGPGLVYRRIRSRESWNPAERRLILLGALASGFFEVMLRGSGDTVHTAQYAVLPALFLVAIAARLAELTPAPQFVLVKRLPLLAFAAFVASGAWLFATQARRAPDTWLSFKSPDTRLAQSPIFAYLKSRSTASDTIAAMPFGGIYNFYTRPAATRYTLMGPLAEHYYTRDEVLDFEREILAKRPKFLVIDFPYRTFGSPGQYLPKPLPGYHLTKLLPDANPRDPFKASIFERDDAPARSGTK